MTKQIDSAPQTLCERDILMAGVKKAQSRIAERMAIARVYTLDRRDFSVIRPKHCDYFDLLPE